MDTHIRSNDKIIVTWIEPLSDWILGDIEDLVFDSIVFLETLLRSDKESRRNIGESVLKVEPLAKFRLKLFDDFGRKTSRPRADLEGCASEAAYDRATGRTH